MPTWTSVRDDGVVLLSLYRVEDAAVMTSGGADPAHRRRFEFPNEFVPSVAHSEQVIKQWQRDRAEQKRFVFATRHAPTGELLGGCELMPIASGKANVYMSRAKRFYEAVFRARLERLESPKIEMWAFPTQADAPGAAGALVKMEGYPSGGNSILIYFSCDDCAIEVKRVADNGGVIHKEKFSIGSYGFIALVTDPEGNMIGLHSMR